MQKVHLKSQSHALIFSLTIYLGMINTHTLLFISIPTLSDGGLINNSYLHLQIA